MKVPCKKTCYEIIRRHCMMDHIIAHSQMVRDVVEMMCRYLAPEYPHINIELCTNAALLHDITKTRSFTTGEKHSETGGELLNSLGFPETGDIIRQHVILDCYDSTADVNEAEIVNYSDKRVLHDRVVSLEKRMDYIREHYVTDNTFTRQFRLLREKTFALENKLFTSIDLDPDDLQVLNHDTHRNS
ncbi:MAG: HDIG domain-containing protein [Desulfarculaceae bacterium]|nr:HDIG domain-containing protein [Desulfarculaceae bacterium]